VILGRIFNIQRYSLHDGPGIRTTVFFKGCPLSCKWCGNPESQSSAAELCYDVVKCARCSACNRTCPTGSISFDESGGVIVINRETCTRCFRCVAVCPSRALFAEGTEYSVQSLMDEVQKDRVFYETSGGGVTLSGGEPLLQKDFVLAFLKELKACGLHVTVETSGQTGFLEEALPFIDLLYFDVKHYDSGKHRAMTGAGNEQILENLKLAVSSGVELVARIPVIPGFNDSEKDWEMFYGLLRELGIINVHLLPFHQLGMGKYERMGLEYAFRSIPPMEREQLSDMQKTFAVSGMNTQIGG